MQVFPSNFVVIYVFPAVIGYIVIKVLAIIYIKQLCSLEVIHKVLDYSTSPYGECIGQYS